MASNDQTSAEPKRRPGPKPGTEVAKRGGLAAKQKNGGGAYRQIGKMGGTRLRLTRGSEFFAQIGQQGEEKTKQQLGREHHARIGRLGGQHRAANASARAAEGDKGSEKPGGERDERDDDERDDDESEEEGDQFTDEEEEDGSVEEACVSAFLNRLPLEARELFINLIIARLQWHHDHGSVIPPSSDAQAPSAGFDKPQDGDGQE